MVWPGSWLHSIERGNTPVAIRALCIVLFGILLVPIRLPQVSGMVNGMVTEDQALSTLRSRSAPDVGFLVVVKMQPTSEAGRISQESLVEARSKHLNLYEDGVFVNLMRAGGYLILEFDKKTDSATKLHLVTSDAAGRIVVQPGDVHGDLKREEALTIIDKSAGFSEAFFSSPESRMDELLTKFGGPGAAFGIPDGQGYLALPETVKGLTTRPGELLELTGLSNGIALWTIRHALAMPVYAANPIAAVQDTNHELSSLVREFRPAIGQNDSLDFIDHLIDLHSIRTRDELEIRLASLRELSSFLDERSPLPVQSLTYKANVSISTIPLNVLVKLGTARFFGATTAPGLISVWDYGTNGGVILKGVSVAE